VQRIPLQESAFMGNQKKISKKNKKKTKKNRFVPRRRRPKMKVKIICKKSFSGFFDYMKKALPSLQKPPQGVHQNACLLFR
jgi:hypothetical protein